MNLHTPKRAFILRIWGLDELSNLWRAIIGVKPQWIEKKFILLEIY
jgi:hypothetical protein